jgi:hypothetical protein
MSVKQIAAFLLARVGLELEVKSQSAVITGFYPDFTIHPGDRGEAVMQSLMASVPDLLFLEGTKGYLVNPQAADAAEYSYGQNHGITRGKYVDKAWTANQVRVEGVNPAAGTPIVIDTFSWAQLDYFSDWGRHTADRNITTVNAGQALGAAALRKAEIESGSGEVCVPVNCGQQLYDVVEIKDPGCGLTGAMKRVLGMQLNYRPERGEYEQTILLGGV